MSYTLVVVDMQPNFRAARNRRVIANVKREINIAINSDVPIIVLEYKNHGPTNRSIARMVRSYSKGYFVEKDCDDGSLEVVETCNIYKLPGFFRVVGVNYGACVRDTALGLSMFGCDVVVVKSACHQPRNWSRVFSYTNSDVTYALENNGVYVE